MLYNSMIATLDVLISGPMVFKESVQIPPLLDFFLQETNPSEEYLNSYQKKMFFGVSPEIHEAAKAKGYRHTFPMEGQTNETFHPVCASGIVRISEAYKHKIPHYDFVYFGEDGLKKMSIYGKIKDQKSFQKVFDKFFFSCSVGGNVALPPSLKDNALSTDLSFFPFYSTISLSTSEVIEYISKMDRVSCGHWNMGSCTPRMELDPTERTAIQLAEVLHPAPSIKQVIENVPTLKGVVGMELPIGKVPYVEDASLFGRVGMGYETNSYQTTPVAEASLDLRGKYQGFTYSGGVHYDLQKNKPSLKFSLNLF